MNDPTIVMNIRLSHKTLAMLVEYYETNNVHFSSQSSIARAAIEDYVQLLLARNLTHEFGLSEAMHRVSHLAQQKSMSHVLRGKLRTALVEEAPEYDAKPVSQETIDEVLRNLGSTTVINSRKEES